MLRMYICNGGNEVIFLKIFRIFIFLIYISQYNNKKLNHLTNYNVNLISNESIIHQSYIINVLNFNFDFTKKSISNYYLSNLYRYIKLVSENKNSLITIKGLSERFLVLNNFFCKKFIEIFLNKKVYIQYRRYDLLFLNFNIIYLNLFRRLKKVQLFNKHSGILSEFIEIAVIMLYSKDVQLFSGWLKKVLENMHFKIHRKFFYLLKIIFYNFFLIYFKYFGCMGFFFKVKGKIGLGGNSKKKRNIVKFGKYSLTQKSLKISYNQGVIRTYSGTLGFEIILAYK